MESTLHFYQILSVLTSFLGLSIGVMLWSRASKKSPANAYLALLAFTYTLFFLPGLADAFGMLEKFHHVIRVNSLAGVLVGPLAYLYAKAATNKAPFQFQKIWFHFIPFFLATIQFIPTYLLSPEEKVAIYDLVIRTGQPPEPAALFASKMILTFSYIFASIRVARRYLTHLQNSDSSIDSSFHRWLLFVCCFFLLPASCVFTIRMLSSTYLSVPIVASILAAFIFIVYFTLNFRPKFFYDFPNVAPPPEEETVEREKYQQSSLQETKKDEYERKLLDFMKQQQPFLNPELTIVRLSKQVEIPAHFLSQLINERLDRHFIDFVNSYRIEEAQRMLKSPEHEHHTIISIAQDAGFNSKTAFYTAFKRRVGCTPSQYREGGKVSTSE